MSYIEYDIDLNIVFDFFGFIETTEQLLLRYAKLAKLLHYWLFIDHIVIIGGKNEIFKIVMLYIFVNQIVT